MVDYYKVPNYPQTSCPCEGCPKIGTFTSILPDGERVIPSSLAFNNCEEDELFQKCKPTPNIKIFGHNEQPLIGPEVRHPNKIILNQPFGLTQATDFYPSNNCCGSKSAVESHDPRLFDQTRGESFPLDRAPYEGDVPLKHIYDPQYTDYGQKYKTFSDIHAGQIQYYVDKDISTPYFDPLFVIRSDVDNEVFIDPMGSVKPQYTKKPLTIENRNLSKDQFMRDSLSFRDDIMSLQMRKMNQENWNMAWDHVIKP